VTFSAVAGRFARVTRVGSFFGSADLQFTLAVALVALLPRLFVAIAWAREPVWDGHYYHFGAERIAEGLGYSEDVLVRGRAVWKPWTHYPVGYSAFLAFFYKIFGSGLLVAPVLNALTGTLLVVSVHRMARYYLTANRARIAAGLCAIHPGLIAYSAVVMTEPLAALLIMGAGLAALRYRGNWKAFIISGALLGFATLVRPSSLLVLPLLALTQPKPYYRSVLGVAIAGGIALALILPWTIRNCVRMDGCALVSTNGGWNLAIGAISKSGRFQTLRASDGCPVVTGQVQQDDCWAEVGRKIIFDQPGRWLSLIPKKLAHTYNHESFAIEYLREANPSAWPEDRRLAARELMTAFHCVLLVFAAFSVIGLPNLRRRDQTEQVVQMGALAVVLGLIGYVVASDSHPFYLVAALLPLFAVLPLPGRPWQGPAGWFLLGLLFVTTLTHAIFFGEDRYHLIVTPALCVLAAAALREPIGSRRSFLTSWWTGTGELKT
jgi:4-amino-4-deoxy-L-arabinose transferase-like glycosyltransferase